jgi:hypothetical protein
MKCPTRVLPIFALGLLAATGYAAPIAIFSGADANVGPGDPTPNSGAAATSFSNAVGSYTLLTMESASGNTSPVNLGGGVTASSTSNLAILSGGDPFVGFNTTFGGARYLQMNFQYTGAVTFTFPTGITAFGVTLTGLFADTTTTVSYFDGANQSFVLPGPPPVTQPSAAQFFGFTNATGFSSLTFDIAGGYNYSFGVDDMVFVAAGPSGVPEPSSGLLAAFALAAGLGLARSRKRRIADPTGPVA